MPLLERGKHPLLDAVTDTANQLELDYIATFINGDLDDHVAISGWESARNYADERLRNPDKVSAELTAVLKRGMGVTLERYVAAQRKAVAFKTHVDSLFDKVDVLLCPSAPGEAPAGVEHTGDPRFNSIWTLAGTPCVTLPAGTGPAGLPLGIQIVGRFGRDHQGGYPELRHYSRQRAAAPHLPDCRSRFHLALPIAPMGRATTNPLSVSGRHGFTTRACLILGSELRRFPNGAAVGYGRSDRGGAGVFGGRGVSEAGCFLCMPVRRSVGMRVEAARRQAPRRRWSASSSRTTCSIERVIRGCIVHLWTASR